ncbi:Variant-specific surface protein [Giardia duodenalis]|uniref:Variant-specific surface protein n=1 Tax=Giardia intestinalis TaxID=5741 RepID=V6TM53_GIAIN|nr:Variant-specific surface protein [Giardia intestinalis]
MFCKLFWINCLLQLAWAACLEQGNGSGRCKAGMCNVQLGEGDDGKYCSECHATGDFIINGVCLQANDNSACKANADKGICDSCAAGYFLYKGGCYKFGELPGKLICNDVAAAPGGRAAVDGVCSECNTAGGFFKHPDAVATKQSCILCNETENISNVKGVVGCSACTPPKTAESLTPATCTKCASPKYLKADGTECLTDATKCTTPAEFGKADSSAGNKCVSCGDEAAGVAGCAECTAPTEPTNKPTCTKCSGDNYLKTVDGTTTCVTKGDCNGAYFPNDSVDSKKQCILCNKATTGGIDGCTECALLSSPSRAVLITCSACVSGKKPNTSGSQCIACDIDGCARCSEASKCSQCGDGYRLESDTCVSTGGNLSSGAIAGISVAAVVVVGGLVGFLCWWFVCRGKA